MELLKLSKFKLHLQALIYEIRELRQKERSAADQIRTLIQKQKQTEEESYRELKELQSQLSSSEQVQQNLERKISCLQNDNDMLENKQKEMKETIDSLLQSRENFVKAYKDSTCEMKRTIESRDRKIANLSEQLNKHLLLLDSIQKEAFSVKQVVDNVQHVLSEKEQIVVDLKIKVDKVSTFEKLFVERITDLENQLRDKEDELRRKDQTISELEAAVEAEKSGDKHQPVIQELQETISAKERIIEDFISEKKALHFELRHVNFIVKKIQDTSVHMNEENRKAFSAVLTSQEECTTATTPKNRNEVADYPADVESEAIRAKSTASPIREEHKSISSPNREMNNSDSCASESAFLEPTTSANVPPQI